MTNDVQTAIRLPGEVIRAVDHLAKRLSRPGLTITRAAALRMLIVEGVARHDAVTDDNKSKGSRK